MYSETSDRVKAQNALQGWDCRFNVQTVEEFKEERFYYPDMYTIPESCVAILNGFGSINYILRSHTPNQVWNMIASYYDGDIYQDLKVKE